MKQSSPSLDLGNDISKSRAQFLTNLAVLKTDSFLNELIGFYKSLYPNEKDVNSESLELKNRVRLIFDLMASGIKEDEFQINFYLASLIEISHTIQTHDDKVLMTVLPLVNKMLSIDKYLVDIDPDQAFKPVTRESGHYDLAFALTLRQTAAQKVRPFLDHHLDQYGDNFLEFFEILLEEHEHYFSPLQLKVARNWLTQIQSVYSEDEANGELMKWCGTQKELAELFVELKRKGWIEGINPEKY